MTTVITSAMATSTYLANDNSYQKGMFESGRRIHWEPGNQVPSEFSVGFTRCRELISLTEGCELTRKDFL